MAEQLLIELADGFAGSQLEFAFPELAAPALFSDEECETLWNRVNRICDQYALSQREHYAA